MKRIKIVLALVASLFLMTGCVKYNTTMEVKKDKSMDFTIIYAMDTSSLGDLQEDDSSNETLTAEQKAEFEKKGYKIEEYSEGNYKGVKLVYSVKNIDDVSKEGDFNLTLSDMIKEDSDKNTFFAIKKDFLKNTYKANYNFEVVDKNDEDYDPSYDATYKQMLPSMDLKFVVTLPDKAKSNNATSVNSNTYTWELNKDLSTNINFEFEMYNMTNIILVAGIAILLFVIILVIIILLATKKKKA